MVESDNLYVISNLVTTCGHVTSVQVVTLYYNLLPKFKELFSLQLLRHFA